MRLLALIQTNRRVGEIESVAAGCEARLSSEDVGEVRDVAEARLGRHGGDRLIRLRQKMLRERDSLTQYLGADDASRLLQKRARRGGARDADRVRDLL